MVLKHHIDGLKTEENIPIKPQQHLWYDAWNYVLKMGGGEIQTLEIRE